MASPLVHGQAWVEVGTREENRSAQNLYLLQIIVEVVMIFSYPNSGLPVH